MPKRYPIFFAKDPDSIPSLDPVRALQLREACTHRVTELAESSYDAFSKGNLVSGYLLSRAIYETVALFWCFLDQVRGSLQSGDVGELRNVLTRILVGSRIEKVKENVAKALEQSKEELGETLAPVHVLKLIKHVAKKIPPFEDHYNFLCEIAHPNAMGLIKAYVRNDHAERIAYFGKEQGKFAGHLAEDLEALILILESFIESYNESNKLLGEFQESCSKL